MDDESKYLMWLKRKQMLMKSSQVQLQAAASMRTIAPIVCDSWEEQAFAEDAAGPLGGCIWPPRSYSCSFCRREFKSAQALGGHMNVHRRDRARLKQQSPSPLSCENPGSLLVASSFSSAPPQENYTSVGEYAFLSPPSHPIRRNFRENHKGLSSYSSTELGFEFTAEMENYYSKKEEEESARILCISNDNKGFVDTNLGLNVQAVAVNNNNSSHHQQGYYDEVIRCKRQKTHVYLMKPCLLQSDDFKGLVRRNSMDELDLELRLGDPTTKVL